MTVRVKSFFVFCPLFEVTFYMGGAALYPVVWNGQGFEVAVQYYYTIISVQNFVYFVRFA